jgi:V-type H+-transporting ATPase subunit a
MKLSVVFGIAQMTFGVLLSILNARFFRSPVSLWTYAIPSLAFLASIFIYLCVLIFLKWIYFSVHPANIFGYEYPGSHCAPSLLIGLINMFMFKPRKEGFIDPNTGEEYPNCHLSTWYPNQVWIGMEILTV